MDLKQIARNLKNDFVGKEVNYSEVRKYIKDSGWSVLNYGDPSNVRGNEFIKELGVHVVEYSKRVPSFAYTDNKTVVILININARVDQTFLLLHEIAHIKCGHAITGGIYGRDNNKAEREANKVANIVLGGQQEHSKSKTEYIIAAILTILAVATLINLLSSTLTIQKTPSIEITPNTSQNQTQSPTPEAVIPQGATAWRTPKGDKYHTVLDCPIIVNRTNLITKDASEFIAEGYQKCQHCINMGG